MKTLNQPQNLGSAKQALSKLETNMNIPTGKKRSHSFERFFFFFTGKCFLTVLPMQIRAQCWSLEMEGWHRVEAD